MRLALLAVLLAGCSICHAPRVTPVPDGVESAAFIDQQQDCYTIELRPEAQLVMQFVAVVLKMTLAATGAGD